MNGNYDKPKVGYVLKRFPRLSETFIRNEILELERQGVAVEIFSLLRPRELASHDSVSRLKAPVTYLPARSMVKTMPILTGNCADNAFMELPFKHVFRGSDDSAAPLFPGKEMDDSAVLLARAAALAAAAWGRGITHLHAHFGTDATTTAMLASSLTGIPYSFTAHAKDVFHTYTDRAVDDAFLIRKVQNARFVATVSNYNREHLAKLVGASAAAKIRRLYNGIDLDRFRPNFSQRETGLILAIGRLIEKKGFHHLIDGCARLNAAGLRFRCVIVGDGPYLASLTQQIAERGLQDRVSLIGPQPEEQIIEMMGRASMLVLPCVVSATGDRDGLPTVLLEALASGLPAISTTVAGIPEIIDHRCSGLLVPPGDCVSLANGMAELLADSELSAALARGGRAKAEREFDVKKNVGVLRSLFGAAATTHPTLSEQSNDEDRVHFG